MNDPAWPTDPSHARDPLAVRQYVRHLRRALVGRKLPPRYVSRFVQELSDHLNDLMEDPMSMDARGFPNVIERLGAPDQLAHAAASEFQRRSFYGRHRVLSFVVLPFVLLPLVWAGLLFGFVALAKAIDPLVDGAALARISAAGSMAVAAACVAFVFAPAAAAAFWLCRAGARAGLGWAWPMLACTILALVCAMGTLSVQFSEVPGQSRMMFGLGIGAQHALGQLLKFGAILAIAAWMLRHHLRQAVQMPTATT